MHSNASNAPGCFFPQVDAFSELRDASRAPECIQHGVECIPGENCIPGRCIQLLPGWFPLSSGSSANERRRCFPSRPKLTCAHPSISHHKPWLLCGCANCAHNWDLDFSHFQQRSDLRVYFLTFSFRRLDNSCSYGFCIHFLQFGICFFVTYKRSLLSPTRYPFVPFIVTPDFSSKLSLFWLLSTVVAVVNCNGSSNFKVVYI